MRTTLCRLVIFGYLLLYLAALGFAVIGTQGLFGTQPDGLAAVWLIFVGLPWSLASTPVALAGLPIVLGQIMIGLAPALNAWILFRICKRSSR